jgi:hypothetical protein
MYAEAEKRAPTAGMNIEELWPWGSSVEPELVEQLENEIGYRLPESYRSFLLNTNGAEVPAGRGCFRVETDSIKGWICIDCFYGVTGPNVPPVLQLGQSIKDFASMLPPGMLPVATDAFGNQILLSLGGQDRGAIFFYNHAVDEPIVRLASSFGHFLDGLQDGQ